jgi:pimeloyl-ACP methyl ester carboxylesterase
MRIDLPGGIGWVAEQGAGPTVLALPGLPGSPRDFRWLGPVLEPHCRLIRPELAGLGRVDGSVGHGPSLPGRIAFVEDVVRAMDVRDVVVVAHSAGAGLACGLAAHMPDRVRGLVLVCPIGLRPHAALRSAPVGVIGAALRTGVGRWALRKRLRKVFIQLGFGSRWSDDAILFTMLAAADMDFGVQRANVARVQCQTAVVWAANDRIVEPAVVQELAAALPDGPRICLETGGHGLLKSAACEVGELVLEMVRGDS